MTDDCLTTREVANFRPGTVVRLVQRMLGRARGQYRVHAVTDFNLVVRDADGFYVSFPLEDSRVACWQVVRRRVF